MGITIENFLNYLQFELNRSALTVSSYGDDLHAFEAYFKAKDIELSWESIDSDVIRDWMESMMDKGNSATSINRRLSALRSFYRYALVRNLVSKDPVRGITGPKRSKPLPQFLREAEMDRLLDDIPRGETYKEVRDYTIIMMFYQTGMRLGELIGLDDAHVDFDNKQGKILGLGSRIIPMDQGILGEFERGNKVSQTAKRTEFRGIRRLRERHLLRRECRHRRLHGRWDGFPRVCQPR